MSYSIADLKANLIPSKTLENGAVVHPGLQIGEMTLQEHQDYLVWMKMQRPLTRSEAILAGHRPKEIYAHFGPLDVKRDQVTPPAQARDTVVHLSMTKLDAYVDVPKVIEHTKYIAPPPQPNAAPTPTTVASMEGFRQLNEQVPNTLDKFTEAKARGYTGDACPDCGGFTMLHNGTCLVCDNCGRTTGCS
jgi:hypothetical protein